MSIQFKGQIVVASHSPFHTKKFKKTGRLENHSKYRGMKVPIFKKPGIYIYYIIINKLKQHFFWKVESVFLNLKEIKFYSSGIFSIIKEL